MRSTDRALIPPYVEDFVICALAVGCALFRSFPLIEFPTWIHEGKGPVFIHYPLLGIALALAIGLRRPMRAVLLFALVHLGSVLALEWRAGLYRTVLGGPITPRAYLLLANAYIVAALAVCAGSVALLFTNRRIAVPAIPERVVVYGIFFASFAARWWWGHHVLAGSNYIIASDDGVTYDEYARRIAAGILPTPDEHYGFGGKLYWFFLAAIYWLAGIQNFNVVIVVQAVLGALVPICMYFIVKSTTGSQPMAIVVALMTMVHRIIVFLSGVLGMEAIYLPLFYVGFAWLLSQPRRQWAYVAIGAIFGLANLARNEVFGYPFLLLLLAIVFARTDRRLIRQAALVCVGFLAIRVVEMGLTYLGYGRFNLPSGQAAITFTLTNYGVNENTILFSMGFNPFVSVSRSLSVWASHFPTVTRLLVVGFVKRFGMFLLMPGDGLFDLMTITDSDFIHNYFPALKVSYPALLDSYGILMTVVGLVSFRRFRREHAWALWAFIVYVVSLNSFVSAKNPRHRAVLIPLFLFAVVEGVAAVIRRVKTETATAG